MNGYLAVLLLCLAVVHVSAQLRSGQHKWKAMAVHCKDVGHSCPMLAKVGYCKLTPGRMVTLCMKSCNFCGKQGSEQKQQQQDGWGIHMSYEGTRQRGRTQV